MTDVVQRLLQGCISVFILFTVVFFLIRLVPGDPAVLLAGPTASQETIELIRTQFGFDRPFVEQYALFLQNALHGDFGSSIRTQLPVMREILERLPYTAVLALVGMGVAVLLGVTGGVIAAIRRNSGADVVLTSTAVLAISVPSFWLALLLMNFFAVRLGWLPSYGAGTWRHFVLPAVVIAAAQVGLIMRVTRGSVIEVLSADYIRTARAKGASSARLMIHHALRGAIVPVITVICLQIGILFNGAVVTETVFNWPGIGRFLIDSVLARDYPAIQALVLVFGVIFILINLFSDMLNAVIDPRLRRAR
ncbi:ABC transporter permease [Celeribacter indicus]|uniref:Glutathione ABC transporter permease GsiC n=1 Tax=Celeribacter indicus TaxID=1208324 RepID=A0A0B5E2P7_9RHOB|nr:ABC transporter permease [Celeribacter indicus]AJE46712.1 glutathione ABC transporter permease GsiC [Celeribacter indicus]SDX04573.1 peptide/nickel transport system permease protein/glutathione transport system permease protein [Celeribacter indicus]